MNLLAILAAATMTGQDPDGVMTVIGDPDALTTRLQYYVPNARLEPPKKSPQLFQVGDEKKPFEYPYQVGGYGRINPEKNPSFNLRFRIFSQDRKEHETLAPLAARMLLQIWDLNIRKIKIDHAGYFNNLVDFYLCWGGTPGGEHRFDVEENEKTGRTPVNTIYIYDLPSFKDPVEMAREIAHEYGHATLSPIGGFKDPEDWGNGQLGEKLYLRWLRDELAAKRINPVDVMNADLNKLTGWVKQNVDPLVQLVVEKGPRPGLLEGTGQGAMDACNGLILYIEELLPANVFAQSLHNLGTTSKAPDYLRAIKDAMNSRPATALNIPNKWKSIAIWVPLAADQNIQNGSIVRREGDWALIRSGITGITSIITPQKGELPSNQFVQSLEASSNAGPSVLLKEGFRLCPVIGFVHRRQGG